MAESNATQVILTDDGIKIINAQNTADNAASQAKNADSAALIAQSTANAAKSAADSNYNYANSEISVQSTAIAKAQSTADNAFSQAQAVGSQASAEISVQSTATAKAQSTADNAFSQAKAVGSQASAEISVQSTATAKAQSTADNAFSQATTAIDNNQVTSQAVTALKDGSTMTIAELQNGLATKVANSDYASYKDQTASQIGQMVTNGAFSAYQTQTANLIAQKVANSDFSAYQATTAKAISSKVESSDFNTYKTQTADLIDDKVSSSQYSSDKTQTASQIANMVSNSAFSTYQNQTASQISQLVTNGAFSAYQQTTADLIASKVANSDFSAYQATTAKSISSKVESSDFNTYKTQTADLIDDKVSSSEYASDKTQTASEIADRVSNSAFSTYQDQTASQIASKVDNGAFSAYQQTTADLISSKVATKDFSAYQATTAKSINSKVDNGDFSTYKTQTANMIASKVSTADYNSQVTQFNNAINLRVAKGDLIDEINLQAGNTLISSSGQLTLDADTIYFDTKNPVIIPNANITDTLNGKTFHDGDIINDANNTSNFYPFTIEPTGKASTTLFNSMDALRTEMSGGGLRTMYRATNSSGTTYEAYDGVFDGNIISLNSGFTNGKDMSFSQAVSGNQLTGQVTLSPLTGINLWGSTQAIHFSGLQMNGTGISFNSYGNIVGDNGSTWFRIVDSGGNQTANFGTAPGNNITFPKPIFVDQVGAYSTSNGGALLLCDNKGTSQIALRNDGDPQVVSSTIYNRTYSSGSTVTVTSYGTMGRITSASKYKLAIAREPQVEPADRLLTIDPSSWVDLEAAKAVAENKSDGKVLLEHEQSLDRHHGLIAEDLRDAGLGEFVIYGIDGEIEGIQYDRLWTILIPKIKQLNERLNELERKSI